LYKELGNMPEPSALAIFVTAALALLLTPGPAVLYIVGRSIEQGRMAGFVSTLGIGLGSVVHIAFAALGLSAVLMQSAIAFSVVKYAGAAYLVYLGLRTLASKTEPMTIAQVERVSLSKIFGQGLIVNLLNPKTALFFFAFLPQFVSPASGPVVTQILFLGAIFVGMAIVSDGMYALVAGTAAESLSGNVRVARFQKYLAGTIYIALGITMAVTGDGRAK
jgi:threonine/homoserine/homoserine lactone efflux protein